MKPDVVRERDRIDPKFHYLWAPHFLGSAQGTYREHADSWPLWRNVVSNDLVAKLQPRLLNTLFRGLDRELEQAGGWDGLIAFLESPSAGGEQLVRQPAGAVHATSFNDVYRRLNDPGAGGKQFVRQPDGAVHATSLNDVAADVYRRLNDQGGGAVSQPAPHGTGVNAYGH